MSTVGATTSKSLLKRGSKASVSEQGSFPPLDVKIVHPQENLGLDGWLFGVV